MISSIFRSELAFSIKNIKIFQPTILFTKNAEVTFIKSGESVTIPPYAVAFLEKGLDFNVKVSKKEDGVPYHTFVIDNNTITSIHQLFENTHYQGRMPPVPSVRELSERIFVIERLDAGAEFFEKLLASRDDHTMLSCKLAYLLTKVSNRDGLFIALTISRAKTFCDKVREIVEEKLYKKWKISDLAEIFYCSEISVRKKLEKENITFNQLMLDIRMKNAARLILSTDCNVTTVASAMGITSTSYFIKQFKTFYGMTPKKFYLNLKH